MTWSRTHSSTGNTYNAEFTKPLVRQLMAFIQRDQREALDWVGGTVRLLPSIVSYQLAPLIIPQFPAVLVAPVQSVFFHDAVGSLESATHLYCAVAVAHQDAQVLAELVQDYVRALDAIFNTLPLSDFYAAQSLTLPMLGGGHPAAGNIQTAPLASGTVKELFVISHNYDEIRARNSGFACAATLELLVDREET